MARRIIKSKSKSVAEKTDYVDDTVSTLPDDSEISLTKREAAKLRIVSVKQASTLLNRDRNTIQKWLDQGCPYVTKADRSLGIAWELDLAEVVKWLEERSATSAAEKFADLTEGQMSEDEAKRRKAVAQAVVAELEMYEKLKAVIPIDDALSLWAKDYAEIKAKVMAIPDILAVNVSPEISDQVRALADKHIRTAMALMKTKESLLKLQQE